MTPTPSLDTRQKLLSTARQMLANDGVEGTTMRKLAERTGVKQPVIYYYFKSKDSLLEEVFLTVRQEIRAALMALPPVTTVQQLMRQRIYYHLDNAPLIMAMLNYFVAKKRSGATGEGSVIPPQAYRHIQQVIEQGVAEGVYRSAAPARDAGIIVHALNGFAMEHFPRHAATSDTALIDDFLSFVERALQPHTTNKHQEG